MKKIWFIIKKYPKADYLVFFLIGLFSLTWFKKDYFVSGGCFAWHPDFKEYLSTLAFLWERSVSTGYSLTRNPPLLFPYAIYGRIFQFFFINSLFYEKFLFYISFSFSGAGTYYLLKMLGIKRLPSFIGALFYMVNPFASIVVWFLSIGLYFPFYSFLPLSLAIFIKAMEGKISLSLVNVLIFIFPLSVTFASPVMFVIYYFIIFTYFIVNCLLAIFLKEFKKAKRFFLRFSFFSFILLFLNAYWIFPFVSDFQHQYVSADNVSIGLVEDLPTVRLNSLKFTGIFRLLGLWSFDKGEMGDLYYPWNEVFYSPLYIIVTSLIGVTVFLGALKLFKEMNAKAFFWLFLFLISILAISGFYLPLYSILSDLYQRFPYILRAFRGGFTKYGFIYIVPYTVLFAFGIEFVQKQFKWFTVFFLVAVLLIGFPFFDGSIISKGGEYLRSYLIKIPDSYYQFKKWDAKDETIARYLVLPISSSDTFSFKWEHGYQGTDYLRQFSQKSILSSNSPEIVKILASAINEKDYLKVNTFLALLNIKKIIFREDYNWNSPNLLTPDRGEILSFLENYQLEEQIGLFKIYRTEGIFLPRIYVPRETYNLKGNLETGLDLFQLNGEMTQDPRKGLLLTDESGLSLSETKDYFIQGEIENSLKDSFITNLNSPKRYIFNRENFLTIPGSKLYFWSLTKEDHDKAISQKDPDLLLEKHLYYAGKRIAEIQEFGLRGALLNKNREGFKKEITETINLLSKIYNENGQEWPEKYFRVNGYFAKLRDEVYNLGIENKEVEKFDQIFEQLDNNIEKLNVDINPARLIYRFDVSLPGLYEINLKADENTNSWQTITTKDFSEGRNMFVLENYYPEENLLDKNLRIKNYQPDSFYKISFSYRSTNPGFLTINESRVNDLLKVRLFPTGENYRTVDHYFRSSADGTEASITISSQNCSEIKVVRIYQPNLVARLKQSQSMTGTDNLLPEIVIQRINPTKYKIRVSRVKDPYRLIFSETYHPGWRLFPLVETGENKGFNDLVWQKLGKLGRITTSLFLKNKVSSENVAEYFAGEIKELPPRLVFMEPSTFETWGVKAIPEERHIEVNGFANSWLVLPADAKGRASYEMIMEFNHQKIFYLAAIVSVTTFLVLLIIMAIETGIEKKNEKTKI